MTDSKPPEQRDEQGPQRRHEAAEEVEISNPYPPNVRAEQDDQRRGSAQDQEEAELSTPYFPNILLFAGGIALFALVLGLVLDWYIDPQTSTQKKDLVQAVALIIAGTAGAIGIYFTWRGQQQARQAHEENQRNTLAQLENAQKELVHSRRGQITARFTQAIDQLGSESLEIKLGGIYSLERTAREDRAYHWPIMEVLTTYVRLHAARKRSEPMTEVQLEGMHLPPPDVQAILTVIGRRSEYHRTDKNVEYRTIHLNRTDLRKADLLGAYLVRANLVETNLGGANLRGANLQGAFLREANLQGADLQGADLRKTLGLSDKQLEQTKGDQNTKLPGGLQRPASWT